MDTTCQLNSLGRAMDGLGHRHTGSTTDRLTEGGDGLRGLLHSLPKEKAIVQPAHSPLRHPNRCGKDTHGHTWRQQPSRLGPLLLAALILGLG